MVVYGVVIPTLPKLVVERLRMDPKYLGILLSAYAAGLILVTPIIGVVSDRFGNRKLPMIAGLLCLMLTTVLFAYGQTFEELFCARMGQGISGGISWTVGFTMLADTFPQEHLGAVMGSALMANTIGFLAGPPLGGIAFEYLGEKAPFLLCAGLAFVDLAGRLLIRPSVLSINYDSVATLPNEFGADDAHETDPLLGRLAESSDALSTPFSHEQNSGIIPQSAPSLSTHEQPEEPSVTQTAQSRNVTMLNLASDPQIVVTLLCVVVSATVFSGIEPTLPIYLAQEFGASPSLVGGMWMLIVIPSMVACSWAGYVSDKYGRKNVTALGMLAFAVSAPLMAVSHSIYLLGAALVLFGAASAVALTPAMPEMADFVHSRGGGAFARAYALYNVAYSSGMFIGPIAGSLLFERWGFAAQMHSFGAALLACAPVALWFHVRAVRRRDASPLAAA